MERLRKLGIEAIRRVALGSTVLGTGGGGDPYVGRLLAEKAVREHGEVALLDPSEVPADACVFLCGMMGAPAVIVEKLPSGNEAVAAMEALARVLGRRVTHISSLEAGGINSMIPIAAAARTGLPLIDADGMGRAFPELQMLLPTLEGIRATPMSLVDEKGNTLVIDAVSNQAAEGFARVATVQMGASATMAFYPMKGSQVATALVPHSISTAHRIGEALLLARQKRLDPIAEMARQLDGREIFRGKIVDVLRRTTAGFVRGEAVVTGLEQWSGQELSLDFQNEFLVARSAAGVLVSTPDLICVADSEAGEPITTEALRYGQRVSVLAGPCYWRWRTPEGLAVVGPQAFGYQHSYVPLQS
jgi:DUF917 family protein